MADTTVTKGHFKVCGREFQNVKWWQLKNLRSTYCLLFFVILTSVSRMLNSRLLRTDLLLGHQWL
jgi:hypothetical protein